MSPKAARTPAPRKQLTMERTYQASLEEVWDLWTTAEGLEAWWGPEGFTVQVRRLELRQGGVLDYAMSATGKEQKAFMARAGMPVSTEHRLTFTEVRPRTLLAYTSWADFIPGVEPYEVATRVELRADGERVHMRLSFDAMHDATWTERARMGHEMELAKLDRLLAGRQGARR
jgi:uncharacterized protein YndB with AHSA1/START domain